MAPPADMPAAPPDPLVDLLRLVAAQPQDPVPRRELARALAGQGRYEEAERYLLEALSLDPGFAEADDDLKRVRGELALVRDPDYGAPADVPWGAADSTWAERQGRDILLVLFAGLGVGQAPPAFIFRRFLQAWPAVDKLFLRDLSLRWYLRGLQGVADDVPGLARWLRGQATGYRRVVFMGTSAGATAALLYGELLQVDRVVAFAPQTLLGPAKPATLQDPRWERRLAVLRADLAGRGEAGYLDLAAFNPLRVAADIYYPADSLLDRAHAERLGGAAVRPHPQPGAGHLLALEMRDSGRLATVIEAALRE